MTAWPSGVEVVANTVTIVVALSGLAIAVLQQWPPFRRLVLKAPIRRAVSLSRHRLRHLDADPHHASVTRDDLQRLAGARRGRRARRRLVAAIADPMLDAALESRDLLPADVLSEVIPRLHDDGWTTGAAPLSRILRRAGSSRASSLLARILYPADTETVQRVARQAAVALDRLTACTPLSMERQGSLLSDSDRQPFAGLVTALTGAPVLVDAAASRARTADKLLLWHSFAFRAPGQTRVDAPARYEAVHSGAGCRAWDPSARPPGDFDARVLDLRSATLAEAAERSYLAMVLETTETCYAATEGSGPAGQAGCKSVPVSCDGADPLSRISRQPQAHAAPLLSCRPDGSRTVLLTSYASLISSDGYLMLAQRTGRVRHGRDVLSATAGGVIEPRGPGGEGDIDACGMPDPMATVLRESREEVGFAPEPDMIRPMGVFLANIRDVDDGHQPTGQLVAVALFIGRTSETAHELRHLAATRADLARGQFEQAGLTAWSMASPDFLARTARRNARHLDQHAMLSALYASVVLFGPEPTRAAFTTAFRDAPWWALSPHADGRPRLVRDPRHLVEDGGSRLASVGPAAWGRAWQGLGDPDVRTDHGRPAPKLRGRVQGRRRAGRGPGSGRTGPRR